MLDSQTRLVWGWLYSLVRKRQTEKEGDQLPKLSDVLTKGLPAGYVPVDSSSTPPPASQNDAAQTSSSHARCPLPPTTADADSLRTFEEGSSTPQWRSCRFPRRQVGRLPLRQGVREHLQAVGVRAAEAVLLLFLRRLQYL